MEALAKAVRHSASDVADDVHADEFLPPGVSELQEASKAWASAALGEYKDELLRKALAISEAMANFTAELMQCLKGN